MASDQIGDQYGKLISSDQIVLRLDGRTNDWYRIGQLEITMIRQAIDGTVMERHLFAYYAAQCGGGKQMKRLVLPTRFLGRGRWLISVGILNERTAASPSRLANRYFCVPRQRIQTSTVTIW